MTISSTFNINSPVGIYIHIPFCIQLCHYCDFNKILRKSFKTGDLSRYQKALLKEMNCFFSMNGFKKISSIYFGGGTPSLYPYLYIEEIINSLKSYAELEENVEITMEVDPKTIRRRTLSFLKNIGVSRISIGAQSFQDDVLEILGRYHRNRDILECYSDSREAGFNNVSLDLMYGVPGQTVDNWNNDLTHVLQLNPEHVSLYNLTVSRGTEFYKKRNKLKFPGEKEQIQFYDMTIKALKKINIYCYEISNFSKKGFESKHNLDCWNLKPYIGLGAGASSFFNNKRLSNVKNIDKYMLHIEARNNAFGKVIKLNESERKKEFIILKLRKKEGFSRIEYQNYFGSLIESDFPVLFGEDNKKLINTGNRIKLTSKGLNLSNEIFQQIF
ncbi:MAG: hypothetical protein ACD_79C00187G0003 [uncultured bacterium]|nr:MAG: hypothetical protein ACD_79C00187G0003 [uncultured bacterium]